MVLERNQNQNNQNNNQFGFPFQYPTSNATSGSQNNPPTVTVQNQLPRFRDLLGNNPPPNRRRPTRLLRVNMRRDRLQQILLNAQQRNQQVVGLSFPAPPDRNYHNLHPRGAPVITVDHFIHKTLDVIHFYIHYIFNSMSLNTRLPIRSFFRSELITKIIAFSMSVVLNKKNYSFVHAYSMFVGLICFCLFENVNGVLMFFWVFVSTVMLCVRQISKIVKTSKNEKMKKLMMKKKKKSDVDDDKGKSVTPVYVKMMVEVLLVMGFAVFNVTIIWGYLGGDEEDNVIGNVFFYGGKRNVNERTLIGVMWECILVDYLMKQFSLIIKCIVIVVLFQKTPKFYLVNTRKILPLIEHFYFCYTNIITFVVWIPFLFQKEGKTFYIYLCTYVLLKIIILRLRYFQVMKIIQLWSVWKYGKFIDNTSPKNNTKKKEEKEKVVVKKLDDDEVVITEVNENNESVEEKKKKEEEEKKKKKSTCCICTDSLSSASQAVELECKHQFCLKCIRKWFKTQKKKTCPVCRNDYSYYQSFFGSNGKTLLFPLLI